MLEKDPLVGGDEHSLCLGHIGSVQLDVDGDGADMTFLTPYVAEIAVRMQAAEW